MASIPPETAAEIQKLEQLHGQHPESRQYFVPLADRYRRLGMVEGAEELLRDGLKRHPDYLSAHIVLGGCLADRGATEEAAEEFRYVLSVDPQNLIALRTLGELAASRGRGDEAERWYRELLEVDPMNKEARQALDGLAGDRGDPSAAPDTAAPSAAAAEPPQRGELVLGQDAGAEAADDEGDAFGYGDVELSTADAEADPEPQSSPAFPEFLLFDEGIGSGEQGEDTGGDADDEEVVTETIAELYTRQGFHDRAAGVYRELIRRNGGSPELDECLAEAERAARGETEPAEAEAGLMDLPLAWSPDEDDLEDAAADADEAFATSLGGGFPEAPGDAAEFPPPPQAGGISRPIRAALGAVLRWSNGAAEAESAVGPVEPEIPIAAAARQSPPQADEEADLSWLSDILDAPAPQAAAPDQAAPSDTAPWEPETPGPAREEAAAGPPGAADEEDLESFQAWLQSLKR